MRASCFLLVFNFTVLITAFRPMRNYIPNGNKVPDPCKPNAIWEGVGHEDPKGGGSRNPFGHDFGHNGKRWTQQVCRMDSDGDGLTNGQELGDPNCTWRRGTQPSNTNISHPGVCEPMDSPKCLERNKWLNCEINNFQCDAMNEPEVRNFQMKFPRMNVPAEETTYICMIVEAPTDRDYHIVANQPLLDNKDVLHHILLYGCTDTGPYGPITQELNVPFQCGMGAALQCMADLIGIWAKGFAGECTDPNAGFRIGPNGYRKLAVQMHWTNPQKLMNMFDSSGMNLFVTPKLRSNDAGILWVGQSYLEIPPRMSNFETQGVCTPECTNAMFNTDIKLFGAFNHMHYLGKGQIVKQYRNGAFLRTVAETTDYRYDSPTVQEYKDPIILKAGDELRTSCFYNSSARSVTTMGGEASTDEMCISFLKYYPKDSIPMPMCMNFKNLSLCKTSSRYIDSFPDLLNGCDVKSFAKPTNPQAIGLVLKIKSNCKPYFCIESCKRAVKEARKHACTHGDVFEYLKFVLLFNKDAFKAIDLDNFMLSLLSCDRELSLEDGIEIGEKRMRQQMEREFAARTTAAPVIKVTEQRDDTPPTAPPPVCPSIPVSYGQNGGQNGGPRHGITSGVLALSSLLTFCLTFI